jgi:hypothetical protein
LPVAPGTRPSFSRRAIIARKHGGADDFENLALACQQCNLHKGTNLTGRDPDTTDVMRLFDPRKDQWAEHFIRDGPRIAGKTPVGRTTAWVLQMNTDERVELRAMLMELGELD